LDTSDTWVIHASGVLTSLNLAGNRIGQKFVPGQGFVCDTTGVIALAEVLPKW
jgi:hypothetical protein